MDSWQRLLGALVALIASLNCTAFGAIDWGNPNSFGAVVNLASAVIPVPAKGALSLTGDELTMVFTSGDGWLVAERAMPQPTATDGWLVAERRCPSPQQRTDGWLVAERADAPAHSNGRTGGWWQSEAMPQPIATDEWQQVCVASGR